MKLEELAELQYITPIANLPSILSLGILSHRRAAALEHRTVAMQEMQDRRARVVVPGGRPLHEYANLYICARNPMLYLRLDQRESLCVLRVGTDVLQLPGVVVADQNAASSYVRFGRAPGALATVDRDLVFAEYWTHPGDPTAEWRHKSVKCAEVLVPDRVDARFVFGALVSSVTALGAVDELAPDLPTTIDRHLYFGR